jgi:threonine-phosphate decarboxylase
MNLPGEKLKDFQTSIEDENLTPPWPTHGGDLISAAQISGLSPASILDFSASINRMGPPQAVLDLLPQAGEWIQSYPDPDCREFKSALQETWNLPEENFIVTNGSTELIYALPGLIPKSRKVIILDPCVSEYRKAFELSGHRILSLSGTAENGFQLPAEKIIFSAQSDANTGAIILGHPSSPAGQLWSLDELKILFDFCEKNKIFLIIDETFTEFSNAFFCASEQTHRHPYLIQIRSMTKFHALPGLRLGYGIMASHHIQSIESQRPPWSVNTLAQKLGTVALRDKEYNETARIWNAKQREGLFHKLDNISCLRPFPSAANFILFQLIASDPKAPRLFFESLLKDGILIRNCENFIGLNASYFRTAVRNEKENQRLITGFENGLLKLSLL